MLLVRSLLFNILFYALLIAMMIAGLPTLLAGRTAVLRLANLWARASLGLLQITCGTRVAFRGIDNIPPEACLIAAKHQSFAEIIALASYFPDFTFVLKRELMRIPLFGWYLARADQIAVDRSRGRAALGKLGQDVAAVLKQGRQVFIFPEGTRRPPGAPPEYRTGLSALYTDSRGSCLPVAVNSGLFWPRRSILKHSGTIVVEFLPVIPPGIERGAFQARMRDTIETASDRLMAEAIQADPGLAPRSPDASVAL